MLTIDENKLHNHRKEAPLNIMQQIPKPRIRLRLTSDFSLPPGLPPRRHKAGLPVAKVLDEVLRDVPALSEPDRCRIRFLVARRGCDF